MRDKLVSIYLTNAEYEALRHACLTLAIKPAVFARQHVLDALANITASAGNNARSLDVVASVAPEEPFEPISEPVFAEPEILTPSIQEEKSEAGTSDNSAEIDARLKALLITAGMDPAEVTQEVTANVTGNEI